MDRSDYIAEQPDFYRDAYRKLLTFVFFMLCLNVLILGSIIYSYFNIPVSTFFITTVDGRLIEIQKLP